MSQTSLGGNAAQVWSLMSHPNFQSGSLPNQSRKEAMNNLRTSISGVTPNGLCSVLSHTSGVFGTANQPNTINLEAVDRPHVNNVTVESDLSPFP